MTTYNKHLRGAILTTAGIVILSPDALIIRLIDSDIWTLLFLRSIFCAVGLALITLILERPRGLQHLFEIGAPELQIIGVNALGHIFFVLAILNTSVANALVILSISPLLGAVLSQFVLRELVSKRTWYAATIVFMGLVLIFFGSLGEGTVIGDLSALATAILMASNFVLLRKYRKVSMIPAVGWSMVVVAIVTSLMAAPTSLSVGGWVYILILGLGILPISTALITSGPRYLPAPEVGLIMLLETLLGPLWVWLVIHETPSKETLFGGTTILCALTIMSIAAIRKQMTSN